MVDVFEDQEVGVYENDFVVFRELPYSELTVVPAIVGVFFGEGA